MTALKMVTNKSLTGNIGAVEDSINPAELIQGAKKIDVVAGALGPSKIDCARPKP